jgi:hypothetical protein
MAQDAKVVFREEQRWWTYWRRFIIFTNLIFIVGLVVIWYYIGILELLFSWTLIEVTAFIPVTFSKMTTEIYADGIYIFYFPLLGIWAKRYPADKIVHFKTKRIFPLREGGYGIRMAMSSGGWLYNVSGYEVVQVDFTDGRRILIGTQRPDELGKAIELIWKKNP